MKSHKKCFVMNIHSFVPTPTKLLKTRGKKFAGGAGVCSADLASIGPLFHSGKQLAA